jgi:hypothetical protein
VHDRLQHELTRSRAQCQGLEDSRISLRYFIVKVRTGGPLEGGGWVCARQAAARAYQESGPVPGAGGQSHFTQVLHFTSNY